MQAYRITAFATRSLLLFGFWLFLLEPESLAPAAMGVDWLVGALTALAAALLSLRLLPPASRGPRPGPLFRYLLRFFGQSLLAGLQVAHRAMDPRLSLDPGLIRQPTRLPGGTRRALFGALTSQVPGTLAVGLDEPDGLLYHCLDRKQAAADGLAKDEALFLKVLGDRVERDGQTDR